MDIISEIKDFITANNIPLNFNRGNHQFRKIILKTDKFTIFDIDRKSMPYYLICDDDWERLWIHSEVVRIEKLPENWKEKMLEFKVRTEINYTVCPFLITSFDQGIVRNEGQIYYCRRYEDPCRDYFKFITQDYSYRTTRGCLEAFKYLKENDFVLTQFNGNNVFAGSMTEDRGWFCRIMFKGYKGKGSFSLSKQPRHLFSAPVSDGDQDLYKSYTFSAGLMVLWGIFVTNEKRSPDLEFPINDDKELRTLILDAVQLLHERDDEPALKELFIIVLEDMLQVDIKKRKNPEELLQYKFMTEAHILDAEEYEREKEESDRVKEKYKEQMS